MGTPIHFAHPGPLMPVIVRNVTVVEVQDEASVRAEWECVKAGDANTPSEYDLVCYLHTGTIVNPPSSEGD